MVPVNTFSCLQADRVNRAPTRFYAYKQTMCLQADRLCTELQQGCSCPISHALNLKHYQSVCVCVYRALTRLLMPHFTCARLRTLLPQKAWRRRHRGVFVSLGQQQVSFLGVHLAHKRQNKRQ
eukprot:scaffold27978_cov20-Tisochrysis_lutea.AAC.1